MHILKKILFAKIRFRKNAGRCTYILDLLAVFLILLSMIGKHVGIWGLPESMKMDLAALLLMLLPLVDVVPKFFDPAVIQDEREYTWCKAWLKARLSITAMLLLFLYFDWDDYRLRIQFGLPV